MARITAINPDEATGKTKELFDTINGKMGMVPNMMRTLGNSPAALSGYLGFSTALNSAKIDGKTRELIALTVANENGCNYCNSAHSYIGGKIGLSQEAIGQARHAGSSDPKINDALIFAKAVLDTKGAVSDASLQQVRSAGYSDGEIIEIVAQVSLSIFTNYINIAAATDIDFPVLEPISKN
ncbi:MAG: carboxymuconolactone decarboxylase family protein [Mucilaginibacter sp.]|nr:carboxymuconolactone decarboxylase family protein [Mucilaginibacter sp.]